jgi:hypothetical protein
VLATGQDRDDAEGNARRAMGVLNIVTEPS